MSNVIPFPTFDKRELTKIASLSDLDGFFIIYCDDGDTYMHTTFEVDAELVEKIKKIISIMERGVNNDMEGSAT